jgi:hypothetical protein
MTIKLPSHLVKTFGQSFARELFMCVDPRTRVDWLRDPRMDPFEFGAIRTESAFQLSKVTQALFIAWLGPLLETV